MKRLLVVLLIVGCLLVVVAPASATTLTGTFAGGVAVRESTSTLVPSTMVLAPVGSVTIVVGASHEITGALRVTAPGYPDQGPFPYTLALRNFFVWDPGKWVGDTYVVTGTIGGGTSREDPKFDATISMPRHGTFTVHIEITNSFYEWDYWDFSGVVR